MVRKKTGNEIGIIPLKNRKQTLDLGTEEYWLFGKLWMTLDTKDL